MSVLYFDASALVKRYTSETGSSWVTNQLSSTLANDIAISEITIAECTSAMCIKHRVGTLSLSQRTTAINLFLHHSSLQYQLIAATRLIIDRAVLLLQNYPLKTYDALQLATALTLKETLAANSITDFIFVSADNTLNSAATTEGLAVENPDNHP